MKRFEKKVVLVTGGTGGIGQCISSQMRQEGATVIVADKIFPEQKNGSTNFETGDNNEYFLELDVSDENSWQSGLSSLLEKFGQLDILINNAGISGAVPDKLDLSYFDKLWAVNGRGTFLGMKFCRPYLARSGEGAIVNMSSVAGIVAHDVTHMGYNAAKAGVRLMTKSAAIQFAPDGIRVNSVHPGWMTPMRTSIVSADPSHRSSLIDVVPMRRGGTAEEAAKAVIFLASSDASYITGSELVVDGGMSAM